MAKGNLILHNAGDRFSIDGLTVHAEKLTPDQMVQLLKKRAGS